MPPCVDELDGALWTPSPLWLDLLPLAAARLVAYAMARACRCGFPAAISRLTFSPNAFLEVDLISGTMCSFLLFMVSRPSLGNCDLFYLLDLPNGPDSIDLLYEHYSHDRLYEWLL